MLIDDHNTDDSESMPSAKCRMVVIGIGGGGCNALTRITADWQDGPDAIAVNTDAQALAACNVAHKVQIGRHLTQGLGAGGDAAAGKLAADDDADILRSLVTDADLAVIVTALGGGTGTGAAPVMARLAREEGAMTLCFATLPFVFEGESRREQAEQGLRALRMNCDVIVCLANEHLLEMVGEQTSLANAFTKSDAMLGVALRALWRLLDQTGIINMSFADLRHLVENSGGACSFGYGEGTGADKAVRAVSSIMKSPMLEHGSVLNHAGALMVHITGGPDLTLIDIQKIVSQITAVARKDVRMFMGATVDERWQNRVALTVLAAENWHDHRGEVGGLELFGGAAEPGAAKKETSLKPARVTQPDLNFDPVDKGRLFRGIEPTLYEGEDLDIPTYVRRGIKLSFEK